MSDQEEALASIQRFMEAQNRINDAHQRSIDAHRELIVHLTRRVELLEAGL